MTVSRKLAAMSAFVSAGSMPFSTYLATAVFRPLKLKSSSCPGFASRAHQRAWEGDGAQVALASSAVDCGTTGVPTSFTSSRLACRR